MSRFRGIVALVGVAVSLAGCAPTASADLEDLRDRFVAAGGVCGDWTPITEPHAVSAATCDEGATLVVFASTKDRADFIKTELETNESIRARTHIIVSKETWLVIDTLAVVVGVWHDMGGMISGRNGANP